ncbi:MFS transporter [Kistimonas asteriae]|uniref:MFS transporter n=1 Tax=Kistimonas asteriae TaxID=517724 RepID=UPI001BA8DED9|nr:MFS transporter [Kistimonas asteriae]
MKRATGKSYDYSGVKSLLAYGVCAMFVALQFLLQGSVSLMVPELQHAFGVDMAGIGLLSSCFFYPYVFMQIPMGRFVSRYGVRRVMFYSASLLAIGCVLFQTATTFSQALVGRMLMGVASASGIVSTLEVISLLFAVRWFGLLAGVMDVVSMVGAAAGEWFIPWEMANAGWEGVLLLSAIAALCISVLACLLLPCRSGRKAASDNDGHGHLLIFSVLRDERIWKVSIAGGLVFALVNSFAAMWAIPYFALVFGGSVSVADVVSLVFVGVAIGAPIIGYFSGCRHQARRLMIVCSIACSLLFGFVLYYPVSEALVSFCLLLMGIACGAYVIPFVQVKKWSESSVLSPALGMVNMIEVIVGTVIFQPLIGVLLNSSGVEATLVSYRFAFNVLLIGLVCGVISAFYGEAGNDLIDGCE